MAKKTKPTTAEDAEPEPAPAVATSPPRAAAAGALDRVLVRYRDSSLTIHEAPGVVTKRFSSGPFAGRCNVRLEDGRELELVYDEAHDDPTQFPRCRSNPGSAAPPSTDAAAAGAVGARGAAESPLN